MAILTVDTLPYDRVKTPWPRVNVWPCALRKGQRRVVGDGREGVVNSPSGPMPGLLIRV